MKYSNSERLGSKEQVSGIPLCRCGVGHHLGSKVMTDHCSNTNVLLTWFLKCNGRYMQDGIAYRLYDHCVCLRNTGSPFVLEITDDVCPRLFLSIPPELFHLLKVLIPELKEMPPVWKHSFSQETFDAFFDIYDHLKRISSTEFYLLIPQLTRYILLITGIQKRREQFPLEKGRRYLEENYALSLSEIAEECGMSYSTFRRHFLKEYGISPGQYRIQKRMDAAVRWLQCGVSVSETAELLGYSDVYTFSHQFTAAFGVPPSRYRDKD